MPRIRLRSRSIDRIICTIRLTQSVSGVEGVAALCAFAFISLAEATADWIARTRLLHKPGWSLDGAPLLCEAVTARFTQSCIDANPCAIWLTNPDWGRGL